MIQLENCSHIALGGGAFSGSGKGYGFGPIDDGEIEEILKSALNHSINIIDLAPVYGYGMAEKRIGKILSKLNLRQKFFLMSKGGVTWHENRRIDINIRPEVLKSMLHQTLSDLNIDVLDAYFIHWPDPRHSMDDAIEFLLRCKEEGKFRYLGLGNVSLEMAQRLLKRYDGIDCIQNEHNLFNSFSSEFLKLAFQYNLKLFGWGTLDKGILTQRVSENRVYHKDDCRSYAPWWNKKEVNKKIKFIQKFLEISRDQDVEINSKKLIWAFLNKYQSISSIIGFKKNKDLVEFMSEKNQVNELNPQILDHWYELLKE